MINKRHIKKIVFFLMTSLTIILVAVTHAAAQQLPFYWDNINVIIDVQTNGDMLVTETQKYVFTADYNTERYRYIPLDKVDAIQDVTVAENNQTIASTTGIDEKNQLWIRWQHQLKAPESHTFVLKYRVVGGLQLDGENTQVYWKAIAAGRKAPINAAKVRVQLPDALSGKFISFINFGAAAVPRQVDPKTFEFVASQPIQPEQELEVQIAFPQAILNIPQPGWQQTGNLPQSPWQQTPNPPQPPWPQTPKLPQSPWQQIPNPPQFSSGEQGFSINLGGIFILMFVGLYPALLIIGSIANRHCPECKTFNLERTYEVLIPATTRTSGKQQVTHHCGNCSYHNEYEEVIPVISTSSGGGGGG